MGVDNGAREYWYAMDDVRKEHEKKELNKHKLTTIDCNFIELGEDERNDTV